MSWVVAATESCLPHRLFLQLLGLLLPFEASYFFFLSFSAVDDIIKGGVVVTVRILEDEAFFSVKTELRTVRQPTCVMCTDFEL